jgi:hypothetical protein
MVWREPTASTAAPYCEAAKDTTEIACGGEPAGCAGKTS